MTGRDEMPMPYTASPVAQRPDSADDIDYFDSEDDLETLDTPTRGGPSRLPLIVVGVALLALLAGGSYVALQVVSDSAPQTQQDVAVTPPVPPIPEPPIVAAEAPVVAPVTDPLVNPVDQLATLPPQDVPPEELSVEDPAASPLPVLPNAPDILEEVPAEAVPMAGKENATAELDLLANAPASATPAPAAADPELASEDFYETTDIVKAMSAMQQDPFATEDVLMEAPDVQKPYIKITRANTQSVTERNILMAERALAIGRFEMAADLYTEVLQKNASDVRALIGRAIASQNQGNASAAIEDYEAALRLKPDNTVALINLLGLVRTEQPQMALTRLDALALKYPSNAGIVAQQALIMSDMGNVTQAGQLLDHAIALEPENPMHYYNRAIIAERSGDGRMAIEMYERSLEVDAIHTGGRKISRETVYGRLSQLRQ
ncbi:MAG: tetratricopeptide repeat protein [Pseudomonadota bacterium]